MVVILVIMRLCILHLCFRSCFIRSAASFTIFKIRFASALEKTFYSHVMLQPPITILKYLPPFSKEA